MVSETVIRKFFEITRLDEYYFNVAQGMLSDFAQEVDEELDANEYEQIGLDYVEFMIGLYAKSFTDEEMTELILQYQKPAFQKLAHFDTVSHVEINAFMEREIGTILEVEIEMKNPEEASATRH